MSAVVTIYQEGLRETQDALREALPDRTARNVMKRVLVKLAQPIAADAIARAPKQTGFLKLNIGVASTLAKSQRGDYRKQFKDDVEVFVAANPIPRAHMMEYGTKKDRPRPYLRPAWEVNKSSILPNVAREMWNEIEKAISRAARKAAKAAK